MNADLRRKQALIERASSARLDVRRHVRLLRASAAAHPGGPRFGAARLVIGAALTATGLVRGARIAAWMRRGLVVANLALTVAGFLAPRVRDRTDAVAKGAHDVASTGEQL